MPRLNLLPSFPSTDRIIVCEGESDFEFLDGIVSQLTPRIFVVSANGKDNLTKYRSFLSQYGAIYIRDRDFIMSSNDALMTLTNKSIKTVWPCYDMEGYLLYTDWILKALNNIKQTPRFKNQFIYIPANDSEIEQTILIIASSLITEYSGRQTLYQIRGSLGFIRNAYQMPDPSPNDATAFKLNDWGDYITQLAGKLQLATNQLPMTQTIWNKNIQRLLQQNYNNFTIYAQTIDNCRLHFSGKDIIKGLVQTWGSQYSSDILRDELIEVAIDYSRTVISSGLRNDPRLNHIALLAEKSLGDGTQL